MLSRIQDYVAPVLNAPKPEQAAAQSSQVFADVLSRESLGALLGELIKRGIDTSKLQIPGGNSSQIPVSPQRGSQVIATPAAAAADVKPTASKADATAAPFVPEFQQNLQVTNMYGGSTPLNPFYFATRATADWIAQKYGTGEVVERPYEGSGGPFSANGTEFCIKLQDGRLVNAGLLAAYYQNAPENQFPGVADQMIRSLLASG